MDCGAAEAYLDATTPDYLLAGIHAGRGCGTHLIKHVAEG